MPNYFQLYRKGETTATPLAVIDEELCAMLGVKVHPENYVNSWVDNIGFSLAMGVPLVGEHIRPNGEVFKMEDIFDTAWAERGEEDVRVEKRKVVERHLKILAYLRENFTSTAWAMNGQG